MSTNPESAQPIVFEVTVPRIVLPLSAPEVATEEVPVATAEEIAKVSLLTRAPQQRGNASHITAVAEAVQEVSTHATVKGLFRLFRLKFVAIPGQLYLLRVHHIQKRQAAVSAAPAISMQSDTPYIDDLACTITFRSSANEPSEQRTRSTLTPGYHDVLITLDDDGIPVSYSIDGAEG